MKKLVSPSSLVGTLFALACLTTAHAQSVRINEFMANNDTIVSPAGIKADWIELFNTTSTPVTLTGMYLSDDAITPSKWQFPTGTTIPANGYLVVWAYDTTFTGALYATWALNKDGEHLRLSSSNLSVIDSVTFGPQLKNRTSARMPNGTGAFSSSCLPTLGMQNTCVVTRLATVGSKQAHSTLDLGPGRAGRIAARFTLEQAGSARLSVLDAQGREVAVLFDGRVAAGTHERVFDAARLASGTYWFKLHSAGVDHVRAGVILR
jgi:hypothetical protein